MKNKVSQKSARTISHGRTTDRIKSYTPKGILPCSAIGTLVGIAAVLALALLLSYLLYQTADPGKYVTPVALSALYISAFIGGFTSSRLNKGSALLCGVSVGAMLTVLTFLLSLAVNGRLSADYGLAGSLALRAAIIVCSVIGAYVGAMKKEQNKKRNNKYKKR